jgi:hypothetical protein
MTSRIKIISVICSLLTTSIWGQQPSPIGIIFNPRVNTLALSGVGGGNLYEFTANKSSTSGQFALDWNIGFDNRKSKKAGKERLTTLTTIFKYNPFLQTNYVSGDSIEMRKLAFVDNEFQMLFGARWSNIRPVGIENNAKMVNLFFFDASMAPYSLLNSVDPLNTGFRNFNINAGFQYGLITNTDLGLIGFTISPQINFLSIYENNPEGTAFEELNRAELELSRKFLGGGFKLAIPLNDFCFFFEMRKYFPLENPSHITGLTERSIFSFGGVATGTVFKTKIKEEKY